MPLYRNFFFLIEGSLQRSSHLGEYDNQDHFAPERKIDYIKIPIKKKDTNKSNRIAEDGQTKRTKKYGHDKFL